MPARVLVVDDEENLRLVLRTLLRKNGYDVDTASSGTEALTMIEASPPDFVIADVRMPGLTGIQLAEQVREKKIASTVIIMSAYGSIDLAIEAMKAGAYDYVSKPFKHDEIILVLKKAEEREQLRRENRALREETKRSQRNGDMIGVSERMQLLYRTIQKAAEYRTTVLIQGESGTGKELVARALHDLGPRASKRFVAINCGAIPEALLESELFGHKRGAFTDASSDKRGLFEEADGGTLFLDEIAELPLSLQVKILRALQEGVIRRLGETRDITVDVRVITATMRELSEEVENGRFREDLYYRLNVLQVRVPALRERVDDIPLLVEHFVQKNIARMGTRVHRVDAKALEALMEYPWPGNVRELENVIERSVVLAETDTLTVDDLPPRVREPNDPISMSLESDELSIKKTTRIIEQTLIRRALEKTRGNRTAAARILEISHRALLYKLKEYGIS